jgi:hypothetical protein
MIYNYIEIYFLAMLKLSLSTINILWNYILFCTTYRHVVHIRHKYHRLFDLTTRESHQQSSKRKIIYKMYMFSFYERTNT